jgi:hypothetical protein
MLSSGAAGNTAASMGTDSLRLIATRRRGVLVLKSTLPGVGRLLYKKHRTEELTKQICSVLLSFFTCISSYIAAQQVLL